MANGFLPDTTPPGSAPMPLGKPAPAPIGATKAPAPPTGPKAPRGGGGKRMLSPRAKKALAVKRRMGKQMPKDVAGVMHEFKQGQLHSGSSKGPKVTSRKQAIAIGLSEQRKLKGGKGLKSK